MFDFLGIGAQKAGTTWLYAQLKQHPDVWMPIAKELHFFDSVHLGSSTRRIFRQIQRRAGTQIARILKKEQNAPRSSHKWKKIAYFARLADGSEAYTDEWYRHVFTGAPSSRRKGEITPLYCSIGQAGVKHVKRLNSSVKLIYLIRDPLDRAMSSLRMRAEDGRRSMETIISEKLFVARCNYLYDVQCWDEEFGEQVLYIPFGHIKSQPDDVMRRVENHLGIPVFGSYERLGQQIHTTNKEVTIPRDIVARLEEIVKPQYGFLEQRFGSSFLEETK